MSKPHKDMTGVLFKNTRRTKDTHPTHRGQGKIFGREIWIAAWTQEGKDGSRYFSFSFEEKKPNGQASPGTAAPTGEKSEFDSEIPF